MGEGISTSLAVTEVGLYIVATPIGHMSDMTFRAVQVLNEVSLIAAEDTRTAQKLLRAHGLHKPLMSLYRDNEAHRAGQVVERLQQGDSVALISEAGTPCISDPGYLVVRAVVDAGFSVIPIPGPSAVVVALSASGLPTNHFAFLGFLPTKSGRRKRILRTYQELPATLVFYESPHRVLSLLEDLLAVLGDRPACIGREMTKIYEEFVRGSVRELIDVFQARDTMRGEFVVMVQGQTNAHPEKYDPDDFDFDDSTKTPEGSSSTKEIEPIEMAKIFASELLASGVRQAKLARQLTSRFPFLSRQNAYRLLQELKEQNEE